MRTNAERVKEPVEPNCEARARGVADRAGGLRLWATTYPPGTYGHADYGLGYWHGEPPACAMHHAVVYDKRGMKDAGERAKADNGSSAPGNPAER